jgi:hypothetical protein
MSTELFRKYIDILKEDSEEVVAATISDITRLKIALQELEAVLSNYEGRINEATTPPPSPTPPTPPASPSYLSRLLSSPAVKDAAAIAKTSLKMHKRSAIKGLYQGAGAAAAWTALTELYNWITSKKLDSLRPGDQEIIKKNIPIIRPWTAPDKLKTLDKDLRFRLLHVVDLLERLGTSLGAQPTEVQNEEVDSDQTEAPDPQVDQKLLNLLDRASGQIDESTQIDIKRFVLQNMHLLSEAEQMAVRRDMLSEIDIPDWVNPSNWPVWAQAAAGLSAAKYGPGATSDAYNAVKNKFFKQADVEAEIEAAKKAAEKAAVKTTAEIDAANKANAIITQQNQFADAQWRATGGPQKGIAPPTPKSLVPVPEMPAAYKEPRRGPINRTSAMFGRGVRNNPKKWALAAAATGLAGMVLWLTAAVKGTVAAVDTGMTAADDAVKAQATELENDLELFRQAARNTDQQLAGTLLQNPEDYLRFAKRVMRHCSKFPNTPDCQDRMDRLCADPVLTDLNGGPLAGC